MELSRALDVSPAWLAFGLEELESLDEDAIKVAKAWSLLSAVEKDAVEKIIASMSKENQELSK
jgi:hypothetical protein